MKQFTRDVIFSYKALFSKDILYTLLIQDNIFTAVFAGIMWVFLFLFTPIFIILHRIKEMSIIECLKLGVFLTICLWILKLIHLSIQGK